MINTSFLPCALTLTHVISIIEMVNMFFLHLSYIVYISAHYFHHLLDAQKYNNNTTNVLFCV